MHVSLAYAESSNNYDYLNPVTNISADNILNGTKALVLNGANASKIIVSAISESGFTLAIVDSNQEGFYHIFSYR